MSTDGIRESIVSTLATKLATVTTGNGYQQTIETVLDFPTHFESLDTSDYPVVSIYMGAETGQVLLGNAQQDFTMSVGLRCYVEGGDDDTIRESANKIYEDINNITLGIASVIETSIVSNDAPFLWLDVGHVGFCDIQLQVLYRRTM